MVWAPHITKTQLFSHNHSTHSTIITLSTHLTRSTPHIHLSHATFSSLSTHYTWSMLQIHTARATPFFTLPIHNTHSMFHVHTTHAACFKYTQHTQHLFHAPHTPHTSHPLHSSLQDNSVIQNFTENKDDVIGKRLYIQLNKWRVCICLSYIVFAVNQQKTIENFVENCSPISMASK